MSVKQKQNKCSGKLVCHSIWVSFGLPSPINEIQVGPEILKPPSPVFPAESKASRNRAVVRPSWGPFQQFCLQWPPSSTENNKNYSLWLLSYKWGESCSFVSDSLWPHRLYSPWSSPGQNSGVGSHSLLQGIFSTQGSNPGLPQCRWILYQLNDQGSHQRSCQGSFCIKMDIIQVVFIIIILCFSSD